MKAKGSFPSIKPFLANQCILMEKLSTLGADYIIPTPKAAASLWRSAPLALLWQMLYIFYLILYYASDAGVTFILTDNVVINSFSYM